MFAPGLTKPRLKQRSSPGNPVHPAFPATATALPIGNILPSPAFHTKVPLNKSEETMNGLIYLIGLIVVILFILSFLGLR